jgi:L-iditol 2-dehydrogenase
VRVARLHGPGDIRLSDEPIPEVEPGMSLVKVTAVGLCGSDLHWYADGGIGDAIVSAPLVIGHEFAGVIEVGPRRGVRVAVDPAIVCGICTECRAGHPNLCVNIAFAGHGSCDGALREFLAWPSHLLHPLPDTMSDADGALLEPLGVAIHALDLAHLKPGMSVAVFGCGPIGLLLIQAARAAGATTVIAGDPLPHRREAALRFGADQVFDGLAGVDDATSAEDASAEDASAEGSGGQGAGGQALSLDGLGVDVAFEAAGTDAAVDAAIVAVRPGARVVLVGIPDRDSTTFRASVARRKGLTIMLVRRMKDVYPRAIELVRSGRVDVSSVVTGRYPLERIDEALSSAAAREGLKVVVS